MTKKITRLVRETGRCLVVSIPKSVCEYENIQVGDQVTVLIKKVHKQ